MTVKLAVLPHSPDSAHSVPCVWKAPALPGPLVDSYVTREPLSSRESMTAPGWHLQRGWVGGRVRGKQRKHTHTLSVGPWQAEEPWESNVALGKSRRGVRGLSGGVWLARPIPAPACPPTPGSSSRLAAVVAPAAPR